jgi:hypothetical protein
MHVTCMEQECIEILAQNIQKKNFIRKITSETEEHNLIYSTKWELSMWIGLIWFRVFGSKGI